MLQGLGFRAFGHVALRCYFQDFSAVQPRKFRPCLTNLEHWRSSASFSGTLSQC